MSSRLVKAAQVAALAIPLALMFGQQSAGAGVGVGPDDAASSQAGAATATARGASAGNGTATAPESGPSLISIDRSQRVPAAVELEDPPGGLGGGEPAGAGAVGSGIEPANSSDSVPNANPGAEPLGSVSPEPAPVSPVQTPAAPAPAAPAAESTPADEAPAQEAPAAPAATPDASAPAAPVTDAPVAPEAPAAPVTDAPVAPEAPAVPAGESAPGPIAPESAPAAPAGNESVPNAIDPSGQGVSPSDAPSADLTSQPVQGGPVGTDGAGPSDELGQLNESDLPPLD